LRGNMTGDFTQTFTLIEEGVTWFADAPKGGGPADDGMAVRVQVTGAPDGGARDGGHASHDGGGSQVNGGCSCRLSGSRTDDWRNAIAVSLLLCAFALRRRLHLERRGSLTR